MLARIVGIVLGLILATLGYVVAGWGRLGGWAALLDLGPFEPHRSFTGGAAAILGGVLVVAALTPRRKPRSRNSKVVWTTDLSEPMAAAVSLQTDPVAPLTALETSAPAPEALVAEPLIAPEVAPTATQVAASAPDPETEALQSAELQAPAPETPQPEIPPPETFAQMRERMVVLSHAGEWAPAARVLIAMKAAARGDHEKAVAYRDLGDFARGQGQMDDAAEAYETAVSYARDARRAAPDDEASLDLLAGALAGVGDAAESAGRLDAALAAFEESLALRRSQGGREAHDPAAQRALSVSLERLADLREDRGHRMRALDLYRESYDVAARLAAADPARFGPDLALTRQRLAELEAKVGV